MSKEAIKKSTITIEEFETLFRGCVRNNLGAKDTYALMFRAMTNEDDRSEMLRLGSKGFLDSYPDECKHTAEYLAKNKSVNRYLRRVLFDRAFIMETKSQIAAANRMKRLKAGENLNEVFNER